MEFEEKRGLLAEVNEEALLADGLEGALIGYVRRFGVEPVALYDYEKCVEILVEDDDCSPESLCSDCQEEWLAREYNGACPYAHDRVVEYLEFNTLGAWAGEGTPAFAHLFAPDD